MNLYHRSSRKPAPLLNYYIVVYEGPVVEEVITIGDGDNVVLVDEGPDVEEVIMLGEGDEVFCIEDGVEVPVLDASVPSGGGGVTNAVTSGGGGGGADFDF